MTTRTTADKDGLIPEERRAPPGMIWQCQACGKEAEDRYGIIGKRSQGWDESCMLNAVPVPALRAQSTTLEGDRK